MRIKRFPRRYLFDNATKPDSAKIRPTLSVCVNSRTVLIVYPSVKIAIEMAETVLRSWHPSAPSPLSFPPQPDLPHFHFDDRHPSAAVFISDLHALNDFENGHLLSFHRRGKRKIAAMAASTDHKYAYLFDTTLDIPDFCEQARVFLGARRAYLFVEWYCNANNVPVVVTARTFERHLAERIDTSADNEALRHKRRTVTRECLVAYVQAHYPAKTDWLNS